MNKSKKHPKTCENCYNFFYAFANNDKIPCCGINGLETKNNSTCNQFEQNYARNKYALCSSSECLDCKYFKKEWHYCNIGVK